MVLWNYIIPKSQDRVLEVLTNAESGRWGDEAVVSPENFRGLAEEDGVKHFGPFWSQNHYMYGKEPWILSRAYAFGLSLLMVLMCFSPFSFARDFGFLRRRKSSAAFPASDEMGLCDKISSVSYSMVRSPFAHIPTLTLTRLAHVSKGPLFLRGGVPGWVGPARRASHETSPATRAFKSCGGCSSCIP